MFWMFLAHGNGQVVLVDDLGVGPLQLDQMLLELASTATRRS